jgi:threonine/homoserine/homoserine lactone efflux protein
LPLITPSVGRVNPGLVLAFWLVAFALIAVPGPDWAFIVAAGARDRVVLPAVGGLVIGYLMLTGLVAIGVGAAVARTPATLTVLTIVGAAYLIWLGIGTLRRPGAFGPDTAATDAPSGGRRVLRGVGVSGLNPKGLLVFLAMLPQFTDTHASWPMRAQLTVLGLVFVTTCAAFYLVLGYGAQRLLIATPTATRVLSRISGTAMVLIGIVLLVRA